MDDQDIVEEIKKILERLEDIKNEKDFLDPKDGVWERPSRRLPSTSLLDEPEVYGRDEVKDTIINSMLSDDEGGNRKICVIAIVGMGGLGKTTLAQLVYSDDRVNEYFELKAWVCVSEEFDVCRVTKTLLQSVSSSFSDDVMDLNLLPVKLKDQLQGKKYFIVLDDVWCHNSADLNVMSKPFKYGSQGSKVLVTTRSERVASIMGTAKSHRLKELTDEASWKLFQEHATGISGGFTADPDLEAIGREIVQKCKGLPLAVKTLGALSGCTLDIDDWLRISQSEIWKLPDEENNILPALRLSYHYLPSHLKRCFAYCSLFPKKFEYEEEQMLLLWMAENLLPNSSRDKKREEWGEEYFNDLVSRSFFQRSSTGGSNFYIWNKQ
ncbi:putative disease resistance RPP13-like protein 1 [Morus notabilis]|uniref:putative disease resistance RPP13-like protein 1 n=1 Tax=Morus notabilis TaxID=981085 RepID=UPI000CECFF82|nr:putative disease resistance RPP13-like protein 1 [Morus notabilis]